jgi:hypothetical protein
MSKTVAIIFIVIFVCINIGIGVYAYKSHKKPKPTPPKPVAEQTQPAPEPELPRVPAHWVLPEIMVSGEVVDGEAQDEDCIDNYLVIKKIDGTQVIVNDIDWSTWKAVEVGDFIN